MIRFRFPFPLSRRRSRSVRRARLATWVAIALVLSLGTGVYFHFRTRAAATLVNEVPSFQADLKNTLDLQAGVGKPTFTRATTGSVTDFEGIIRQAKANEARFEGARRVENLVSYSESFSNVVWSKFSNGTGSVPTITDNYTGTTDPRGTYTSTRAQFSTGGTGVSDYSQLYRAVTYSGSGVISIWMKSNDGVSRTFTFRSGSTETTVNVDGTWKRFSASDASSNRFDITVRGSQIGNATADVLLWHPQAENVTGQANQNPSEYVSTNVLTSAPYHGANVDGVKYFTYQNGNTVASNVVTEAQGAAIPDATLNGYLAEGQRTNLLTYSEQFDNAVWTKPGVSVTANAATAPDGTVTADTIYNNTASSTHIVYQQNSVTSGSSYTFSVYLKKAEYSWLQVVFGSTNFGSSTWFNVNLDTGTIGNHGSSGSWSVQSVGNGWYRVTLTGTAIATGSDTSGAIFFTNNTDISTRGVSYTGDGTSGVYFWGAQLEQASFASSYIPTTSATVTRNGDALSYPAVGNINLANGSYYAESIDNGAGTMPVNHETGALTNTITLMSPHGSYDRARFQVRNGSSLQGDVYSNNSVGAFGFSHKYAAKWGNNMIQAYFDGISGTADTSATMPVTYGYISIGNWANGFDPEATVRNVKIWKKALTDAQLTNMTSATDAVSRGATTSATVTSDAPSFAADLKNTLDLQAGVGKSTFTRATTGSVTDFEGIIRQAKANEARFEGARRVENLVTYSEQFDNAAWFFNLPGSTVVDNGDGSNTITWGGSTNDLEQTRLSSTNLYSRKFVFTVYVKATGSDIGKTVGIKLRRIGGTDYEETTNNFVLSGSWQRISTPVFTGLSDTVGVKVMILKTSTNNATSFMVKNAQVEEVTGQANQNPSEYVSTNVLTSAPYHGANVDGVKYFTYQNGNTVASNVVTEAQGAAIPDATLKGYLAEGQRTNLLTYSEQFDNAVWTKSSVSVSADAITSPSGAATADTLTASGANGTALQAATSASAAHTFSIWLKRKTGTGNIDLTLDNGATWTTKTITSSWARYDIKQTLANPTSGVRIATSGDEVYAWGAQLEQASFASSYIPTTSATVTRNGDVLSYPGGNTGEGALSVSFEMLRGYDPSDVSASTVPFQLGTYTNNSSFSFGGYGGALLGILVDFGSIWSVSGSFTSISYGVSSKVGMRIGSDLKTFSGFKDGIKYSDKVSSVAKTANWAGGGVINIGSRGLSGVNQNLNIKNVKIWKKALTDTQLTNMTSATGTADAVSKTIVNASQNTQGTSGLAGFWSFNGTDMSGVTAFDRSGNNRNGTLTNGPARVPGKVGQALRFDGTDDYVGISSGFGAPNTLSLSLWFRTRGSNVPILGQSDVSPATTATSYTPPLSVTSSGFLRGEFWTGSVTGITSSTAVNDGAWHHAVLIGSTNTQSLYLDNVLVGSRSGTISQSWWAYTTAGAAYDDGTRFASGTGWKYFPGDIDEVRVYSQVLSASEIRELYNFGR